jgi:hypothetical protein
MWLERGLLIGLGCGDRRLAEVSGVAVLLRVSEGRKREKLVRRNKGVCALF